MIKKFLLLFFVLIMLCGCSAKPYKEEITFSSWGSITEVEVLRNVIKDFEIKNPNIKVNFIHIPQNYFQKIHLLFASNTPPDVLFMNNLYLPIYESRLEDLDGLVKYEEYYPQSIIGMSYNGKLKGVPRDISNLVLYVNTDKINLPDKHWNLENLLRISQDATNSQVFGISFEEDIYWAMPYLNYFGGDLLNDKFDLIADNQESKNGIEFYKNLTGKYGVAPTPSQVGSSTLAQMFIEERLAMYLSGRWMYPKIAENAKFNWAVINFPYGKGKQNCDVSGWVISKSSRHKESAKKFVEYLASEETSEYFTKTGLIVPARVKVSKLLENEKNNEKVFLEVIKYSKKTPVNKNYKKIVDAINIKTFN